MSIDWIKVIIKYKKEIILLILTIVLSAIIVLLLNDTSILFWKVIGVPVQNNIFGDISTIPTLEQYYSTENIRVLKSEFENVSLEYDYLSSAEKLLEYQSQYFDDELIQKNINDIKIYKISGGIKKIKNFKIIKE